MGKKEHPFVLGSRYEEKVYNVEEVENGNEEVCECKSNPKDNTIDLGNWDDKRVWCISDNPDNINLSEDDGVNGGECENWDVNRRGHFLDNEHDSYENNE